MGILKAIWFLVLSAIAVIAMSFFSVAVVLTLTDWFWTHSALTTSSVFIFSLITGIWLAKWMVYD